MQNFSPRLRTRPVRANKQKKTACLICGATKWPCSYTKDEEIAFCANVASDRRSKDAMTYVHFLRDDRTHSRPRPSVVLPATPSPVIATPDRTNLVYSALLDRLTLRPEHLDNLLKRGLSLEAIRANNYRSTPTKGKAREIVRDLATLGLSGVPGFFRRDEWEMVGMCPGYLLPYRGASGRILGLSYRLDVPLGDAKYLWASSPPDALDDGRVKYPQGTALKVPLHHAGRHLFASASEIWLTEGGLKADVASHLLGVPFIAAGGVWQFGEHFAEEMKAAFPHASRYVVAFDVDWRTNPQVKLALEKLMRQLSAAGLRYVVRTWPTGKGIDDYALLAQSDRMEVAA
jgi:hypothetical protein